MTPHSPDRPINFQGKDPDERFCFYFRQHWIRLLWPLMRTLLLTTALVAVGWITIAQVEDEGTRRFFLGMLFVLLCLIQFDFLARFYRYFLYVVIVSDRSVHRIKKTLLTVDDHESIDLAVLQDIHKSQHGVIQNLLGFGTLLFEAQDTHLKIHFTPHIAARYHELMHLREEARRRFRYDKV